MNNWMQGKFADAKAAFKRTLAIDKKTVGLEHPQVATDINNLGMVLKDQGDLAGARACFERALAIAEKALGPDHPTVANTFSNLGSVLQNLGDLAGARACFERALAIAEKALGPDHPLLADFLRNLAWAFWQSGDMHSGIAAINRSIILYKACANRYRLAECEHLRGKVLEELHEIAATEESYISALGNYEAAGYEFGTSSVLADTAAFYLRQKRFADAAAAITKSIQVLHRTN